MQSLLPTAETVTYSQSLAAVIFILFLYGVLTLFGVSDSKSYIRLTLIVLVVGILFASLPFIRAIGNGLTSGLQTLLGWLHLQALSAPLVLSLLLALLIALFWSKHQKAKDRDNKYMWFTLAAVVALMSVGIVAVWIQKLIPLAADALHWLQNFNF
jgi:amino acid permease